METFLVAILVCVYAADEIDTTDHRIGLLVPEVGEVLTGRVVAVSLVFESGEVDTGVEGGEFAGKSVSEVLESKRREVRAYGRDLGLLEQVQENCWVATSRRSWQPFPREVHWKGSKSPSLVSGTARAVMVVTIAAINERRSIVNV